MSEPSRPMRELIVSNGNEVRGGSSTAASRPKTTSPASSFCGFCPTDFKIHSNDLSEIFSPIESDTSSAYTSERASDFRTALGSASNAAKIPISRSRDSSAACARHPRSPLDPAKCIHHTHGAASISQNAGRHVKRMMPRISQTITTAAYTTAKISSGESAGSVTRWRAAGTSERPQRWRNVKGFTGADCVENSPVEASDYSRERNGSVDGMDKMDAANNHQSPFTSH